MDTWFVGVKMEILHQLGVRDVQYIPKDSRSVWVDVERSSLCLYVLYKYLIIILFTLYKEPINNKMYVCNDLYGTGNGCRYLELKSGRDLVCGCKASAGSIHYSGTLATDKEVPTCLSMPFVPYIHMIHTPLVT